MSSETTATSALSEVKAKWTDNEKLALLMSVIMDTNPNPNWPTIALPQGRTLRASQAIFGQLKKEAAAVPMADGAAIPPTKKRGRKSTTVNVNEEGTAASPKKRGGGRKPKNAGRAAVSGQVEDDEEEKAKKKVKVDAEDVDEDQDGMNGESRSA